MEQERIRKIFDELAQVCEWGSVYVEFKTNNTLYEAQGFFKRNKLNEMWINHIKKPRIAPKDEQSEKSDD